MQNSRRFVSPAALFARQRRLQVVPGALCLAGLLAVALIFGRGVNAARLPDNARFPSADVPPVVAQATPPADMALVVIALQDLPRGLVLTDELLGQAVGLMPWPVSSLPPDGFANVEALRGMIVRSDIPRGSPVLASQVVQSISDLAAVGSDLALQIPSGLVAFTLSLDPLQVVDGLAVGDSVDVLLLFAFVDVDEQFQTRLPNGVAIVGSDAEGDATFTEPLPGRLEASALSPQGVLITPGEAQRPRTVTQRAVANAPVLKLTDLTTHDPAQPIVRVTLAVSPQDALVLQWAVRNGAPLDLTLHSSLDAGVITPTESVTLEYLISMYEVRVPPNLPFALDGIK